MDMAKGLNSGKKRSVDLLNPVSRILGRREESKTACGAWGSLLAWPLLLLSSSCKGISAHKRNTRTNQPRKKNTRTNQADHCAMHASTFHGRESSTARPLTSDPYIGGYVLR
jgi:hypothetical protein